MGVIGGLVQSKGKLIYGFGTSSGWLAPRGHVALEEGQFGFGVSIPLP